MGQEIKNTRFSAFDERCFSERLRLETTLLTELIQGDELSSQGGLTGFELEGWLVQSDMTPAPINDAFIHAYNDPGTTHELAQFNVEFNSPVFSLHGDVLTELDGWLAGILAKGHTIARSLGAELLFIGCLPTLEESHLCLANMSRLNRYQVLNERILAARNGQRISLNISGRQHLEALHNDVMLEAATTSFQLHWQIPHQQACRYYNAALQASAPVLAVAANSPYVFAHDLWAETRIALFEQSLPVQSCRLGESAPLPRVSFGSGYALQSIVEVFQENLSDFPVLMPALSSLAPHQFPHLKLHNGTIWRWNRPLVGMDVDGVPHIRLEHRPLPAGPTAVDMVANAALFYGLTEAVAQDSGGWIEDFATVRDNFYQAAQHGLDATLCWGGRRFTTSNLMNRQVLPMARRGLAGLGINEHDANAYLDIIEARVASGQTGYAWQRRFIERYPNAFAEMTRHYLAHQRRGQPVHEWSLLS